MSGAKIKFGKQVTPSGEEYTGFSITIGGITDPADIKRSYDDIERILHVSNIPYQTHEVDTADGKFCSYSVSTN